MSKEFPQSNTVEQVSQDQNANENTYGPAWGSTYPKFIWQPNPASLVEWAGSGRIETAGEREARAATLGSLAVEVS